MKNEKLNISGLINHLRAEGSVILLESQMMGHPASTKSYLAGRPNSWIKARGRSIEVWQEETLLKKEGDPWEELKKFRDQHADWMFGYLGYDLKNHIEKLHSGNKRLINSPDLFFMVPELLVEVNKDQEAKVIKGELPQISDSVADDIPLSIKLTHKISETDYVNLVEQAQQDIFEGRYYEINLSHALEFNLTGDSWNLYKSMKSVGPVPFGGYVQLEGTSICCSSPERFLAREGSRVWSQPIKGTASRKKDSDSADDIEQLRGSEKERAENLMIVDLVRNDLSRIAKKNSVNVSGLFEVQSFETVHQMVSTVECEVAEDKDSIDIIRACFPMGSMTGAPKIASMKAIEQYENYQRGIYSGALGYMRPDGDFDFNVVIRTAITDGKTLIYPVGGAITSDSNPRAEWEETLLKARAITNIFENMKKPE